MTAQHPWLKIAPEVVGPSLDAVSIEADFLWNSAHRYMAKSGLDGVMPKNRLALATVRRLSQAKIDRALAELITEGLFEDLDDKIRSTHWEQPPVDVWTDGTKRMRWQRGKALLRDSALCQRIKDRDRNLCRYCGERVNWNDKRGRLGGTYDHVDPDGSNDIENVVVACRRCNGTKKDRTPEQAGMSLYRAGTTAAAIAAGSARPTAASAAPGQVPDQHGRHGDPNRNQLRSESEGGSARARARDRTEPDPNQIGSGSHHPAAAGSSPAPDVPPWSESEIDTYPIDEGVHL